MARICFSFDQRDRQFAAELALRFMAHGHEITTFEMEQESISGGTDWTHKLRERMKNLDFLIALLSRNSLKSLVALAEVEVKCARAYGVSFIHLIIDNTSRDRFASLRSLNRDVPAFFVPDLNIDEAAALILPFIEKVDSMAHQPKQAVPLEIYLAYENLPARHFAAMLSTLDMLYETIAADSIEKHLRRRWKPFPPDYRRLDLWLPLCIDSVETGQSINVRFAAKGESSTISWQRDLDVILPRSTAPLCAIGVMLTGGAWSYERYLDIQYKNAQIENLQAQTETTRAQERLTAEQVELTRAQTAEILAKRVIGKRQQRTSANKGVQYAINSQLQNFYSIVNQANITHAEVNGSNVRDLSEQTE